MPVISQTITIEVSGVFDTPAKKPAHADQRERRRVDVRSREAAPRGAGRRPRRASRR